MIYIYHQERGEIEFSTFKKFFDSQSLFGDLDVDPTIKTTGDQLEEYLKSSYNKADASNLATYLRDRWKTFASFRREGVKGEVCSMVIFCLFIGFYILKSTPRAVPTKGVPYQFENFQNKLI